MIAVFCNKSSAMAEVPSSRCDTYSRYKPVFVEQKTIHVCACKYVSILCPYSRLLWLARMSSKPVCLYTGTHMGLHELEKKKEAQDKEMTTNTATSMLSFVCSNFSPVQDHVYIIYASIFSVFWVIVGFRDLLGWVVGIFFYTHTV